MHMVWQEEPASPIFSADCRWSSVSLQW